MVKRRADYGSEFIEDDTQTVAKRARRIKNIDAAEEKDTKFEVETHDLENSDKSLSEKAKGKLPWYISDDCEDEGEDLDPTV
jgi:hypothetical protein